MVTSLVAGRLMPRVRAGISTFGRYVTLSMEPDIHVLADASSAEKLAELLAKSKHRPVLRGDYTRADRAKERVGTYSNPRVVEGRVTVDIYLNDSDLFVGQELIIEPLVNAKYPKASADRRHLEVVIGVYPQ